MKKLFLLVVILFTTFSLSSQISWSKADLAAFNSGNGYGEWQQCNLDIKFNTDLNTIIIYSESLQVLYLQNTKTVKYLDYEVLECTAIDNDFKNCGVYLYSYKDGNLFIELRYNNLFYMYHFQKL